MKVDNMERKNKGRFVFFCTHCLYALLSWTYRGPRISSIYKDQRFPHARQRHTPLYVSALSVVAFNKKKGGILDKRSRRRLLFYPTILFQ